MSSHLEQPTFGFKGNFCCVFFVVVVVFVTIQYNTIRVYCENTLSYNNGALSLTGPKSGSVKARQLIYRHSTNTIKLKVKKVDMEYSKIKIIKL